MEEEAVCKGSTEPRGIPCLYAARRRRPSIMAVKEHCTRMSWGLNSWNRHRAELYHHRGPT